MAIVSVNVVVFGGCGILHATVPRPKGGTVDDLTEGSRSICIWRVYTWFLQYHDSIIKSSIRVDRVGNYMRGHKL